MSKFVMTALLFGLIAARPAPAQQTVTLASLEWPPYTGAQLPDQGAASAVAKAAFEAMGYRLRIEFFPWSRAVKMARSDPNYAGYFPEYHSSKVTVNFVLSDPIGEGPLGLVQRIENRIQWNSVPDLARWRIGVVQDYVNTAEFDARLANRKQRVDPSINDSQNLLKLAAGRIDLAIVDPYVFSYLSSHDRAVALIAHNLEMNPKLLENKKLYACFARTAAGERWARVFNEGLRKIDVAAIMRKYIKDYRAAASDKQWAKATSGPWP